MANNSKRLILVLALLVLVLFGGWLANKVTAIGWQLSFNDNALADLAERLAIFAGISLVVERAVEAFLKVSGLDVGTADTPATRENTVPAVAAALAIGLVLGVLGVRILDTFVEGVVVTVGQDEGQVGQTAINPGALLYAGVDVLLSAGLLAGGAVVFHPLLKSITELFTGFQAAAKGRRLDHQTQALDQEIERFVALRQIAQLPLQNKANPPQPSLAEKRAALLKTLSHVDKPDP